MSAQLTVPDVQPPNDETPTSAVQAWVGLDASGCSTGAAQVGLYADVDEGVTTYTSKTDYFFFLDTLSPLICRLVQVLP